LWCIDPTGRGDVSAELVVDRQRKPVPHRRIQAAVPWESIGEIQLSLADALQAGTVSPELRRKLAALGVALPKSCDLAKEIVGGGWLLTPSEQPIEAQYRLQTVRSDKAGDQLAVARRTADFLLPNPRAAVVWHYDQYDQNGDG